MEETIIVANGVSETELLRTLAKNGKNTFGVRVMSPFELAKHALESIGESIEKKFVASTNEAAIVFKALKEELYFEKLNYEDAINLFKAIDEFRLYIEYNELVRFVGIIKNEDDLKNSCIYDIFCFYKKTLLETGSIDTIETIRTAIDVYEEKKCELAQKIIIYDEFPLKPLEMRLVKVLTKGQYEEKSLSIEKNINIAKYIKSFGIRNEIEHVFREILDKKISFDECTLVCPETTFYPQIINDYCALHNIPVTTNLGTPFNDTRVGRLFNLIDLWLNNYSGKDSFLNIINDISFDKEKLLENIEFDPEQFKDESLWIFDSPEETVFNNFGYLRINRNKEENLRKVLKCIEILENDESKKEMVLIYRYVLKIVEEFNEGIIPFIKKYVRKNPLKSEDGIIGSLEILFGLQKEFDLPLDDVIKVAKTLASSGVQSSANHLHVTSINKAFCSTRPYMFILGLSNGNFPGSPKENPVILDEDFEVAGVEKMSEKKVLDKKKLFFDLLHFCNQNNSNVYLSYSSYNESSLKNENCSSVIFEAFQKEYGLDKTLEDMNDRMSGKVKDIKFDRCGFFDANLDKNSNLGKAYINRIQIENNAENDGQMVVKSHNFNGDFTPNENKFELPDVLVDGVNVKMPSLFKKHYSASAIMDFVECEALFYFKDVLKMEDEWKTDEFKVIKANEFGTLVHAVLEDFDKKKETKEQLIERGLNEFGKFLCMHIPVNEKAVAFEIEELKRTLSNAYDMLGEETTVFKEKDLRFKYKDTGIIVHGLPDKIIKLIDGNFKIIDYKIKDSIDHDSAKLETCLQIILYAYLYKKYRKDKINVETGSFYYLKQKREITVKISDGEVELDTTIEAMKQAFTKGEFLANGKGKACDYCKFAGLCGKENKKDED